MNNQRKMAVVRIDFRTLSQLMCLPEGQEVTRAEYDIVSDSLRVLIEGNGLPAIPCGCPAMEVRPTVQEVKRTEFVWPQEARNG